MAGSRFAYVRNFELPDPLLPDTFLVVRLDGHSFHKFSEEHSFEKPNDERALKLMDHAARALMDEFKDISLAYGQSDEFRHLPATKILHAIQSTRKNSKIVSTLASYFTSVYVMQWSSYFPDTSCKYPPCFDGRVVAYPAAQHVRDYFSWRQADAHINNLYNTVFWALVQQNGQTTTQAHDTLKGTVSSVKHEILFQQFGVNYSTLPARYRKGSVLVRQLEVVAPVEAAEGASFDGEAAFGPHAWRTSEVGRPTPVKRPKKKVVVLHEDIIENKFWDDRPELLL